MKKTKRFLGFLLMAAMLMSSICVSATDSAEATLSPYSTAETVDETNPKWGMKRDNNAAYMFSVDNTNFTLLEAAEDGSDFLVLADGARNSPSSIIPTGITDPVTSMDPAKNSYLPTFLNSTYLEFEDDTKWTYYPTGQTNLWIYGLGKKVADYVNRDALWKTEKSAAGNEYVFKAAVTLPSVSEIYKYRDKIGYNHGGRYTGWGTRTAVMAETESNAPNMVAFVPNGDACSTNVTGYTMSSGINLRPILRLKREFFMNNNVLYKLNDATLSDRLADMGSEVKKMLVANFKRSELTGVYSDEELTEIGFGFSENAPKITNIQVKTNIATPGGTATLSYTSTPASDENIVTWYIAGDAEGTNPVKIDGASGAELTIPSSAGGMFLMAGITPILDEEIGSIVYSQPIPIEAALSPYSTAETVDETNPDWGMKRDNNADYMFSVNKTNFTLLEAAEDGSDFLVLVDGAFNSPSSIIPTGVTDPVTSMDPAKNSYLPTFLNSTYLEFEDDTKWTYYPTGQTNLWIYGLGKKVADYVNRDALWKTEKSAAGNEYVFKAAVTLPSVSEIYKYRDKIGYNHGGRYTGWGTRTAVMAETESNAPNMVAFVPNGDACSTNVTGYTMSSGINLRPILRLKREFFMNNNVLYKLNDATLSDRLADMGSEVKKMLVANFARSELKGVYSDEELTAIGFSDNEPEISNVTAQGIASVAQTLTAGFEYYDPKGSEQKSAEYQWYSADSAGGTLSKIDGATDKTYKVTQDMLGKYIAVSVKVYNSDDAKSATVFSPLAGPIAEREEVVVTPISISNTGAEFSVDNAKTGAADMVILYCVYDKTTNALVRITPVPISAPTGESRQSVTLTDYTAPDDCKVKAMVWDGLNTIVPYAMIEK